MQELSQNRNQTGPGDQNLGLKIPIMDTKNKPEIELTEEQLSAVEMVKNNRVSVLTGGPGTGKTTTVKKVLAWAKENGLNVVQCAPTGKAAKRMSEATDFDSATIHRVLGAMMEGDEFVFECDETNPIFCDLLIADELSMVTNDLMADLLRAVDPKKTRILFVGDSGQLPSIGAGAVLRDILGSKKVPHVELTKIHRNSGEIVKACHKIAKGENYTPCATLDLEKGLNLRHIEALTPENIQETIQTVIGKMPARKYDPVWDVQVITATNTRSALSCEALNKVLQEQLNPRPANEIDPDIIFRIGDKVIQTKNKSCETVDGEGAYIVNGDIGKIVRCNPEESFMHVTFFYPDRTVKISKKANELLLAYAITCHRAQGSEAPVVIIPVHSTFRFFTNRNWIYTAISRAKDICFTVGPFRSIRQAIQVEETYSRKTFLAEKIRKGIESEHENPN